MMVKKAEEFTLSELLLNPFLIIRGGQPGDMMTRWMTRLTSGIWHMCMEDLVADDNDNYWVYDQSPTLAIHEKDHGFVGCNTRIFNGHNFVKFNE